MDDLPFEWVQGELIEQAYIEIDGVKHYVTPAQYDYGTSLSAYHLNRSEYEVLERAKNTFSKKAVEIFNGSTKGGTDILDDNVSNYNYFEIFYVSNDGTLSSTKVYTNYASSFNVDCNVNQMVTHNNLWAKYTRYTFSGKSITVSGYGEFGINASGNTYQGVNNITITKILAYDIGGSE